MRKSVLAFLLLALVPSCSTRLPLPDSAPARLRLGSVRSLSVNREVDIQDDFFLGRSPRLAFYSQDEDQREFVDVAGAERLWKLMKRRKIDLGGMLRAALVAELRRPGLPPLVEDQGEVEVLASLMREGLRRTRGRAGSLAPYVKVDVFLRGNQGIVWEREVTVFGDEEGIPANSYAGLLKDPERIRRAFSSAMTLAARRVADSLAEAARP